MYDALVLVASIFAGIAAIIHVAIFAFESVLWSKPTTWRRFGVRSQDDDRAGGQQGQVEDRPSSQVRPGRPGRLRGARQWLDQRHQRPPSVSASRPSSARSRSACDCRT